MLDEYVTDHEIIEKFKISKHTLQKYRTEGKLPYSKFGGTIVYRVEDIKRMIEARMIETSQRPS